MDFIKNLSIHDNDSDNPPQSATSPPPPPPSAIDGPQHESLFDKISTAFGGERNTTTTAPEPSQPHPVVTTTSTTTDEHHHSLSTKLSTLIDNLNPEEREKKAALEAARLKAEEEARLARVQAEEEEERRKHQFHPHHLLDKISGTGESGAVPVVPVAPATHEEGILSKLGLQQSEPAPPPVPPKDDSILDKIGAAFGHEPAVAPPPPPPKEESFLDKIGTTFGHTRVEEPPKPQTLGEKIESRLQEVRHGGEEEELKKRKEKKGFLNGMKVALGGGQEEEVDEDALDKAIDFVQEHVLHQGSQKDEGFLERMKDDQIASAIRRQYKHTTGKEFPVKNQ